MVRWHCAFDGMPAVTLIRGTAVCNNAQCQELAMADARPTAPQGDQTPHGPGVSRRVLGPNEAPTNNVHVISNGILRKGATGLEVQDTSDVTRVLHICNPDEIGTVLDFLSDHFPKEWSAEMSKGERVDLAVAVKEVRVPPEEERTWEDEKTRSYEAGDGSRCDNMSPHPPPGQEDKLRCELPFGDGHTEHRNGETTWQWRPY